jgi:hypothetical protein
VARSARLSGRSLEPGSNARSRGMTATRKGTETGLQPGGSLQFHPFRTFSTFLFPTRHLRKELCIGIIAEPECVAPGVV